MRLDAQSVVHYRDLWSMDVGILTGQFEKGSVEKSRNPKSVRGSHESVRNVIFRLENALCVLIKKTKHMQVNYYRCSL